MEMEAPIKHTRILLLDDDEDDYLIVNRLLAKIPDTPFDLEWINNIEEGEAAIDRNEHDVYLIDYRLGAKTGMEILHERNIPEREQPFIILTGAGDENIEREAMKVGAADYLVKGTFNSELLSRAIRYALQRKKLESMRVKELIDINRSKDEFIALASHQLRTPATAVKQYIGMMLQGYAGEVDKQQQKYLENAYESNERQLQVVDNLLRIAQLDLEKIILRKEDTDIQSMLRSIIRDQSSQFKKREQTVEFRGMDGVICISADPEYLRMAFGNIIDNASKYTRPNKSIIVGAELKNDNTVIVTVTDQGVGIAQEDMEKLFKKFSRVHNPLSIQVGGTGLGLYWSYEIITMHGGNIMVKSKIGKGTSFIITLPVIH